MYRLSDRCVSMDYSVRRYSDSNSLSLISSVRTTVFSDTCFKISDTDSGIDPFVIEKRFTNIQPREIHAGHVRQASDMVIRWAQEQDFDETLREHAALPTSAPGARPIRHLAALALIGDADRLTYYLKKFDAEDRLGFVDHITQDHVERALEIAKGQESCTQDGPRHEREIVTEWQDHIVAALGATARPSPYGPETWAKAEAEAGCIFPAGLKALIDRLGAGSISEYLILHSPSHDKDFHEIGVLAMDADQFYSYLRNHHPDYYPRPSPPREGAALGFAHTIDYGAYLSFICGPGDPDKWPVAMCHQGADCEDILADGVAEFFFALVENRLRTEELASEFLADKMTFEPY